MKKMLNKEHLEGRIYQHDLMIKTVQNKDSENFGKEFIAGNIEIAVDENGLNVIPVHFTYVTEMTSSGKKSPTFSTLKKIIEENKTWIQVGKDEALKVKIDTALALNDFYTQNDELVSAKVNEGGFISLTNEIVEDNGKGNRCSFEMDMLITNVKVVEADGENIKEDYAVVKGAIFNFRNALLPMEFIVRNPKGIQHFEGLNASNAEPVFTKVWGKIVCETIVTTKEEDSAFGEAAVKTYEKKTKEWVILGASVSPYDFGDEKVLTAEEVQKAAQDREVYLADVKRRAEEYKMSKATAPAAQPVAASAAPSATVAKPGGFTF